MKQITEGVFYTGVLNPSLRVLRHYAHRIRNQL